MDFSKYGGPSKEWLAVEAAMPARPAGQTPLERRDAFNARREAEAARTMATLADQIELMDVAIPARDGAALEGRLYWPRSLPKDSCPAVYLHLHGGGYMFGTLAGEDGVCATTALKTTEKSLDQGGVVVLNLNYRHTPEHDYPTAWHDVQDTLVWIHAVGVPQYGLDPARVVVGGISAGGHLTAALALEQNLGRLHSLLPGKTPLPPLAGLVLIVPALVHTDCYAPVLAKMADGVSSYIQNKDAPVLPLHQLQLFQRILTEHATEGLPLDPRDTKLNPGNATVDDVRGLAPVSLGICGLDPFRDEGLLFAQTLTEGGVPVNCNLFKGVPHGFRQVAGEHLSLTKSWDDVQEGGILWALSKPAADKELTIHVHTEPGGE